MSHDAVLGEFIDYQVRFVEQKAPWSNFSICPFAERGRRTGRIGYHVFAFTKDSCLDPEGEFQQRLRAFAEQTHPLVLLFIHPDRRAMSYHDVEHLIDVGLAPLLRSLRLEAFSGHPDHPLAVQGVYLRREPFITIQVLRERLSQRVTQALQRAHYFDGWSEEALEYAASQG
jgi:hypothetical protein